MTQTYLFEPEFNFDNTQSMMDVSTDLSKQHHNMNFFRTSDSWFW